MHEPRQSGTEPPASHRGHDGPRSQQGPDSQDGSPDAPGPLFRDEALREHAKGHGDGDLVRISPRWASSVYWFLTAAFVGALLLLFIGRVPEYATGLAIVRLAGHTELAAVSAGVVVAIEVQSGDRVRPGQVLVRFDAREVQSTVDNLQSEYHHALVAQLRSLDEASARAAVDRIRTALEPARERLNSLIIRAPFAGTVYNVRARTGQMINQGEPIASLVPDTRRYELVALMPGRYAPLLHKGQALRLRLTGYSHAWIDLTIQRLGDSVIGPDQVARTLGPDIADVVSIAQPVILAHVVLPGTTFTSDSKTHSYVPGLQGTAEACVGDERIVFSLIPWAKQLWGR